MKEIEIHFKGGDGKKIKTLPEVPDNSDYVDLLTSQNIDGKKNFTQTPTINGKDITTQEKLNEVSNSKQNTLTAGTGISIENDTISVTDAGGLTVLRQSDFPLSADLLAKVKANPQNYCISYDSKMYYYERYNTSANKIFYLSNKSSGYSGIISQENLTIDDRSGIKVTSHNLIATLDNKTIGSSSEAPYLSLYIKGIEDTTDNTIKTGTEIRKAITIRKWH